MAFRLQVKTFHFIGWTYLESPILYRNLIDKFRASFFRLFGETSCQSAWWLPLLCTIWGFLSNPHRQEIFELQIHNFVQSYSWGLEVYDEISIHKIRDRFLTTVRFLDHCVAKSVPIFRQSPYRDHFQHFGPYLVPILWFWSLLWEFYLLNNGIYQ